MDLIIKVDSKMNPLCNTNPHIIPDCICEHIKNKVGSVSEDQLSDAIDVLITHFNDRRVTHMVVDVSKRNKYLMPPKEMSLKEIEQELGYKVKIVEEKGDK